MRTYIAPVCLTLIATFAAFYFFILEAQSVSSPTKSEDVAMDSDATKHFSSIAEKYASEASGATKN